MLRRAAATLLSRSATAVGQTAISSEILSSVYDTLKLNTIDRIISSLDQGAVFPVCIYGHTLGGQPGLWPWNGHVSHDVVQNV